MDIKLFSMVDVLFLIQNYRLVVSGDSLGEQVYAAAICNWRKNSRSGMRQIKKQYSVVDEKVYDQIFISKGFWLFDLEVLNRTYTLKDELHNVTFKNHFAFLKMYRPDRPTNFSVVLDLTSNADVLLLNFGIHWMESDVENELSSDYLKMFKLLSNFSSKKVLIFFETLPQHFMHENGEFSKSNLQKKCVPIKFNDNRNSRNKAGI